MLNRRFLSLSLVMMTAPGCVLSLSPLPASYGPPQWQTQGPVYSTPAPEYPKGTPEPTRDLGPLPPALEQPEPLKVPDLRGTSSPARVGRSPRRVCTIPD